MARIVVTGGAGFVGTNLVRELLKKSHEVVVIDDMSTGISKNISDMGIEVHEISLIDKAKLREALIGAEHIFHLAARGSVPRSIKNPVSTFEINVCGTQNVLEIAREGGAQVIFSSSSSVYGKNLRLPKNEKMWTSPISPYAASKLAGEALMQSYASSYGLNIVNFRFFNIFGPFQRPDHVYAAVIPKWIWSALNNQKLTLFGDGSQTRDFTFIDTVVEVLMKTLSWKKGHEDPINLAFGNRISLNDVLAKLTAVFPDLRITQQEGRSGDVLDSQNDPNYIRQLFPDVIPVTFESGFEKTINWFRSEGIGFADGPTFLNR
jgi:UDP-glucose 4-epimerase